MIVDRPESFYNVWLKKTIPLFIILSRCTSIFFIDFIFPMDIIIYILCINLRIEQQFLDFRFRCTCFKKECIIKWWKIWDGIIPITNKIRYYPKHCNRINCHSFSYNKSRCKICFGWETYCDSCIIKDYYNICHKCSIEVKTDDKYSHVCSSCSSIKKNYLFRRCDYCDKELCRDCTPFCPKCYSNYCGDCLLIHKSYRNNSNNLFPSCCFYEDIEV